MITQEPGIADMELKMFDKTSLCRRHKLSADMGSEKYNGDCNFSERICYLKCTK